MSTDDVDPLAQLAEAAARLDAAERRHGDHFGRHSPVDEDREQVRVEVAQTREALRLLCKVLIERGQLAEGHLRLVERLLRSSSERKRPRLRVVDDKRSVAGADIDCASRFHLCHGRCCTYEVELAREDLAEGLKWEIDEPYLLLHEADGWCTYFDRAAGGCTSYEQRPAICREYECTTDSRVWRDFEARIPAPLPERLRASMPACVQPPRNADDDQP